MERGTFDVGPYIREYMERNERERKGKEEAEALERRFTWQREEEKIRNAPSGYPLMSNDFSGYDLESRMMKQSLEEFKLHLQRIPDGSESATEKTFALLNIKPLSSSMLKECTYSPCWK